MLLRFISEKFLLDMLQHLSIIKKNIIYKTIKPIKTESKINVFTKMSKSRKNKKISKKNKIKINKKISKKNKKSRKNKKISKKNKTKKNN